MEHQPVLLEEVCGFLQDLQPGVLLDATVGLGGHARAFLERFAGGEVVGLDRDAHTLEEARRRLERFGSRVTLHHGAFADLEAVLDAADRATVDAALFDLGVSSPQLDDPARGFSFRADGPLDMRMDPSRGETAAELVARLSERELADLIFELGDERASRRIAAAVARERARGPIESTERLAGIVRSAFRGRGHIDNATRTFQALRMAVNDELGQLRRGLDAATARLRPGGRLLVLAFHSGEDRVVKQWMRSDERLSRVTKKAVRAGEEERRRNPRARSARLRVAERRVDHA